MVTAKLDFIEGHVPDAECKEHRRCPPTAVNHEIDKVSCYAAMAAAGGLSRHDVVQVAKPKRDLDSRKARHVLGAATVKDAKERLDCLRPCIALVEAGPAALVRAMLKGKPDTAVPGTWLVSVERWPSHAG